MTKFNLRVRLHETSYSNQKIIIPKKYCITHKIDVKHEYSNINPYLFIIKKGE